MSAEPLVEPSRTAKLSSDVETCYFNYQVLHGETAQAMKYLAGLLAHLSKVDAPLGRLGSVIGRSAPSTRGMDVWLRIGTPPSQRLRFQWEAARVDKPAKMDSKKEIYRGQQVPDVEPPPWDAEAGFLYVQPIHWKLPAGIYRVRFEMDHLKFLV